MATAQVLRPGLAGQPDIDYAPNFDKYLARVKRRTETEDLDGSLPPGFPERLESGLVWEGTEVGKEYDWIYQLSGADVDEIEGALKHFQCSSPQLCKA